MCFYITITCSQLLFNDIINLNSIPLALGYVSLILIALELLAYFALSFKPFKNFIFKDPITHKYGLDGHPCENHHHHH